MGAVEVLKIHLSRLSESRRLCPNSQSEENLSEPPKVSRGRTNDSNLREHFSNNSTVHVEIIKDEMMLFNVSASAMQR